MEQSNFEGFMHPYFIDLITKQKICVEVALNHGKLLDFQDDVKRLKN